MTMRVRPVSPEARRLAAEARRVAKAAGVRRPLYHGTRYARAILASDTIQAPPSGQVSLSRRAEEAAYWALLDRTEFESAKALAEDRGGDEGAGSILIFDRATLPPTSHFHDHVAAMHNECEEAIWGDLHNVNAILVGKVDTGETITPEGERRGRANGARFSENRRVWKICEELRAQGLTHLEIAERLSSSAKS